MTQEIDIVVIWVDGSDKNWQEDKRKYDKKATDDDSVERYRDWGFFKYWFRGIEKFAPWVRKVHFVTYGHLPDFLNTKCDKLHIVNHKDYIPSKYLPTFSSHPIELNLHRIEGLSEQFIYFNDDMHLIREVQPEDFFINGKPVDMLALQPVIANPNNPVMSHIFLNNSILLSKHFNKYENIKKQPKAYFKMGYPIKNFVYNFIELAFPQITGFYTVHSASPFLKSTFEELWEKEKDILCNTSSHRFRSEEDVNQYVFREWQKLSGNFVPRNVEKYSSFFFLKPSNEKLCQHIVSQKTKLVCINDVISDIDFESVQKEVVEAFEKILPEKSCFEK